MSGDAQHNPFPARLRNTAQLLNSALQQHAAQLSLRQQCCDILDCVLEVWNAALRCLRLVLGRLVRWRWERDRRETAEGLADMGSRILLCSGSIHISFGHIVLNTIP